MDELKCLYYVYLLMEVRTNQITNEHMYWQIEVWTN